MIAFLLPIVGCGSEPSKSPVNGSQTSSGDTESHGSGRPHPGFIGGGFAGSVPGAGNGGGFGGGLGTGRGDLSSAYDGTLDGDYVLLQSGQNIKRYGGKGATPLVIKLNSGSLPLMPLTEDVGEQLLEFTGRRVRLWGWMRASFSKGHGDLGGQQGDRQAVPDHVVSFLVVDTVEAI